MHKNSLFMEKLKKAGEEGYVFWVSLIFYALLWFLNPGNKIIAFAIVVILPAFLYFKNRNLRLTLLLTYFVSWILPAGKTYHLEIFPPGFFDEYIFPLGVIKSFTFLPFHIVTIFMIVVVFRDLLTGKIKKFTLNHIDILLILYFLWMFISDYFASEWFSYSTLQNIFSLIIPAGYFFIRIYGKRSNFGLIPVISVFASQIIFESFVSFNQLIAGSPIYKNIESVVGIDSDQFGLASDQLGSTFRPMGTFSHANELGMWLVFFISFVLALTIFKPDYKKLAALISGSTALVTTLSRSAWLGFFAAIVVTLFILEKRKNLDLKKIIFSKHKIHYSLIIFPFFLILLFIFPRTKNSFGTFSSGTGYFRYEQIKESLGLIYANPVFGVGTGMFLQKAVALNPGGYFVKVGQDVHNWYLLTATEKGLPSIFLFIALIYTIFRKLIFDIEKGRVASIQVLLKIGLVSAICANLVVGVFQPFIAFGQMIIVLALVAELSPQIKKT